MFETVTPVSSLFGPARRTADPDEALVDAWVNRGDSAALAELVERHQAYVFRVVLSVLGPGFEADAEDVTQETFIRAAERLQGFRGGCRFRTWLHRLALNLALDRRRRSRWRLPHVDITVLERSLSAEGPDDPFVSASDAERARALHECLDGLPDSLRAVLHLRYWLGLTIEEMAATLQLPLGTVKSHLHRGRTLLFRAMEARGIAPVRRVPAGGDAVDPVAVGTLGRPHICLEARP